MNSSSNVCSSVSRTYMATGGESSPRSSSRKLQPPQAGGRCPGRFAGSGRRGGDIRVARSREDGRAGRPSPHGGAGRGDEPTPPPRRAPGRYGRSAPTASREPRPPPCSRLAPPRSAWGDEDAAPHVIRPALDPAPARPRRRAKPGSASLTGTPSRRTMPRKTDSRNGGRRRARSAPSFSLAGTAPRAASTVPGSPS